MIKLAAFLLLAVPAAASFRPHPALEWSDAPGPLTGACTAAKERADEALAKIGAERSGPRGFDDTAWALDRAAADLSDATAAAVFLKYVSVSSATREAANECETLIGKFGVDMYAREDLYKPLKAYAARGEKLAPDAKRLVDKQLLEFRRSGLELEPAARKRALELRRRLVELEAAFGRNINESKGFALFEKRRLAGLPEDFKARLENVGGKSKVSLDYPDYFPFMENALDGSARRELEAKFSNRAYPENLPILREALELRREAARALGYPTHAHFVLEDRMAKDPDTVSSFLSRVRERLKPLAERELETMTALKHVFEGREAAKEGLRAWDWRFYDNQLKKTRYAVDSQRVRAYFPMNHVTEQLLAAYQELFGLAFRQVPGAASWHPDVRLYAIFDKDGKEPLAWFYMDLFPREGKYKHAAAFSLISGRTMPDGRYQRPVSAMVANFDKPAADRPSLLTHDEVETYFHEFGHIMHQTLTKARYARFSGSATARDFVEAPSQMLESWVWDAAMLKRLSAHHEDPSRKLPDEDIERIVAAKNVNSGLFYLRQLLFGTVDMLYHTEPPADTTKAYAKLMESVSMIPMSEGTHPEASFGHLMGYDAGYYGYLWSKVYAEDMASVFKKAGLLDKKLGRRYRREILEKGSSRDERESLEAFLGRAPAEDAFLESLGLSPKS